MRPFECLRNRFQNVKPFLGPELQPRPRKFELPDNAGIVTVGGAYFSDISGDLFTRSQRQASGGRRPLSIVARAPRPGRFTKTGASAVTQNRRLLRQA